MATAQSPLQEATERLAEIVPGLAAAAHAQALRDFAASQADYRQRVRDAHAIGARALGVGDFVSQPAGSDPMAGNIIITGDISTPDPARVVNALAGQQPATSAGVPPGAVPAAGEKSQPDPAAGSQTTTPPASKGMGTLAKIALASALAAGSGGAGAGLTYWLTPKAAAVAAPAAEYVLELVTDKPTEATK